MSAKVTGLVWTVGPLVRNQRILLAVLGDIANEEGYAWPKIETLGKRCLFTPRYVMKTIQELESGGWLRVERKAQFGRGNHYWINVERLELLNDAERAQNRLQAAAKRGSQSAPIGEQSSPDGESDGFAFQVNTVHVSGEPQFTCQVNPSSPAVLTVIEPSLNQGGRERERVVSQTPLDFLSSGGAGERTSPPPTLAELLVPNTSESPAKPVKIKHMGPHAASVARGEGIPFARASVSVAGRKLAKKWHPTSGADGQLGGNHRDPRFGAFKGLVEACRREVGAVSGWPAAGDHLLRGFLGDNPDLSAESLKLCLKHYAEAVRISSLGPKLKGHVNANASLGWLLAKLPLYAGGAVNAFGDPLEPLAPSLAERKKQSRGIVPETDLSLDEINAMRARLVPPLPPLQQAV